MGTRTIPLVLLVLSLALPGFLSAKPPAGKDIDTLAIVDAGGKEHKFKSWTFTAGTRHLSWLEPAAGALDPKGKGAAKVRGPEALEFSEGTGTPLKKRVVTYVLLENIRSLEFDAAKNMVTLKVARSDKAEDDIELTGVTGYVGVNVFSIKAKTDLGELGEATAIFHGGVQKGVQSIRFLAPKPVVMLPKGAISEVTTAGKTKTTHQVTDLQPVYQYGAGDLRMEPLLYFKETVKVEFAKLKKLALSEGGGGKGLIFDVSLGGGKQAPLELIERVPGEGKSSKQLEGLLGRTPAGWKLFPLGTVGEWTPGIAAKKLDI